MGNLLIEGYLPTTNLLNMNEPPKSVGEQIRRNKDKAVWREACYYAALAVIRSAARRKEVLPYSKIEVQVTLGVPDRRQRDPHNYEANAKPMIDALVDAGIVPNDTPQYVQVLPMKLSLELKGKYRIEITPVEEPA